MTRRLSLRSLMLVVALFAVLFAMVIPIYRSRDPWQAQYQRALEWSLRPAEEGVSRVFIFDVHGDEYGISTRPMRRENDGWIETRESSIPNGYFAYPPGQVVQSIGDAFTLFKDEGRRSK